MKILSFYQYLPSYEGDEEEEIKKELHQMISLLRQ